MAQTDRPHSPLATAVMILAVPATVVIVLLAVRGAPSPEFWTGRDADRALAAARRAMPGVRATLAAGGVTVERRRPVLDFRLEPGESLDPALAAGPFRGVFEVTFDPGAVRSAFFGAVLQGGSVIVRRGETLIHSDASGAEPRRTMSSVPIGVGPARETIVYEFTVARGDGPVALRARWQPMGSAAPSPLLGGGAAGPGASGDSGAPAGPSEAILPGAAEPR
jgi:hypothetical protein